MSTYSLLCSITGMSLFILFVSSVTSLFISLGLMIAKPFAIVVLDVSITFNKSSKHSSLVQNYQDSDFTVAWTLTLLSGRNS